MQFVRRRALNLGMWPRMAIGISLGFVVLFAAFLLLGEWVLRDNTNQLLNEHLVVTQMAASQIDELLEEAIAELKRIQHLANFDPLDPDLADEVHALALIHAEEGLFASGSIFLDSSGRIILAHPPHPYPLEDDLSDLPHVALALTRHDITISEPFLSPLDRRPVVAVTVPVQNGSRFVGLLTSLMDLSGPEVTRPLQQAIKSSQTDHAVLIDSQGRILASTFGLPFLSLGEHFSFYRRAMAQGQPTVETVPFELDLPDEPLNHIHVMAFAPLQHAPWGVAIGGDLDQTLAGVRRLEWGLALLGTVALASVWAATLVGTRRLVRPIQYLTESAQRIAHGELQTRLQLPEGGEISILAAALENMRQQLLANIEALANWNRTLETRVARQTETLREQQVLTQQLLHRAITAQEEERARLARGLHDGVSQMLTAVELSLDRLTRALPAEESATCERLNRARALTEQTLTDLRHIITALRPGVLDQLGLAPALEWLADHTLRPLGLTVNIETNNQEERLPSEIETILFRIAQEAMSNVARHSQARRLHIRLLRQPDQVSLVLADDGRGFDLAALPAVSNNGHGLGLAGMQERASLAGGRVILDSAPGRGTSVHVIMPLPTLPAEPDRLNPLKSNKLTK